MKRNLFAFLVIYCATASGALLALEPYHYETDLTRYIEYSSRYMWADYSTYCIIRKASIKHNVPMKYIAAVIETESGGRNVVSHRVNHNGSRDYGLMQLNSVHGYSIDDMMNKEFNIDRGTKYLSECRKRSASWYEATSRYNTGYGAKWINYKYANKVQNNLI